MMATGLYVHVPFCETKCGYCDFYSVPLGDRTTAPLVRAIAGELDQRAATAGEPFDTIFVGGGTPTLLPAADLKQLFGRLGALARRDAVQEFTTEANPATVDGGKIATLRACGVNRMSFGGQSFHQAELDVLERLHHPQDIAPGVHLARDGGIEHLNLDLIFGIPGQTLDSWSESIHRALDLNTDHLACYGLTFEPETPLTARMHQGRIEPCDNALEADMYLLAVELLHAAGLRQYEISNFARPGCECRHNLIYWQNGAYLGIGPSAASYLDGRRFKNIAHIERYLGDITGNRPAWREEERLSGAELAGETAMLQLRLNRGIDVARFTEQVGLNPLELFERQIRTHVAAGLMHCDATTIRLTDAGRLVADRIIRDLLPEPKSVPLCVLRSSDPTTARA